MGSEMNLSSKFEVRFSRLFLLSMPYFMMWGGVICRLRSFSKFMRLKKGCFLMATMSPLRAAEP